MNDQELGIASKTLQVSLMDRAATERGLRGEFYPDISCANCETTRAVEGWYFCSEECRNEFVGRNSLR